MRELLPSNQEVQDFQDKAKSNIENLIAQGNSLIKQAQNIQHGTNKAASLLDAIGKWWTGESQENKPQPDEIGQIENSPTVPDQSTTVTDKSTNATVLPEIVPPSEATPLLSTSIASSSVLPKSVRSSSPPNSVNLSAEAREKNLFHRRSSPNNRPYNQPVTETTPQLLSTQATPTTTAAPITAATPSTILPELSGLKVESFDSVSSDNIQATPIPISRSAVPFRLRSSAIDSSDRLLQSSPPRVPATLFTRPKR
jgi:hypothetical protein